MQSDAKNSSDQGIHFLDVKSLKKSFSSGADPNFPVVNVKSFTLDSNHQYLQNIIELLPNLHNIHVMKEP